MPVGDVTVYNVQAMVMPQPMPMVLLGNSFLSHFQMHSDSSSLVLDKKNWYHVFVCERGATAHWQQARTLPRRAAARGT